MSKGSVTPRATTGRRGRALVRVRHRHETVYGTALDRTGVTGDGARAHAGDWLVRITGAAMAEARDWIAQARIRGGTYWGASLARLRADLTRLHCRRVRLAAWLAATDSHRPRLADGHRLTWILAVQARREEIEHAWTELREFEETIARLQRGLSRGRRMTPPLRRLSPGGRRNLESRIRTMQRQCEEHREALIRFASSPMLGYTAWRESADAWLRRQLAGLEGKEGA